MFKYIFPLIFFCFFISCEWEKDEELNYNPFDETYQGGPPVSISNIRSGEKFYYIKNATDTVQKQFINLSIDVTYKYGGYIVLYRDGIIINEYAFNAYPKAELTEIVCVYANIPFYECFSPGHTFVFQTALKKGSKYSKQSDPFSFSLP